MPILKALEELAKLRVWLFFICDKPTTLIGGCYHQNSGETMLKIKIARLWWACLIAIAVKN